MSIAISLTSCLKRRRGHGGRRKNKVYSTTTGPDDAEAKNISSTDVPVARRSGKEDSEQPKKKRLKSRKNRVNMDTYDPPVKKFESTFVEMPKDLYQAHLRPGVIFRIHMAEAILKMQYRNYGEDKDESVIEADVEYLRLTRKVINDEITKFEDLKWLVGWFNNRSELIQEHMCNTRYYAVGIPPTMFTHSEEYMKRMCLFDNVYIDHIPYVIGEDGSLLAAVAPPVLHCDAATCTSVPFIDSIMSLGILVCDVRNVVSLPIPPPSPLLDNVYIDHVPYVIGEDGSLLAAVAPPVLHCDAATCTSVPFIDSLMFDERLSRTNVRTVTRCQASCRARCKNDPDCLKRCSDRCLRAD